MKNFLKWLRAVVIMIPVTVYVLLVGGLLYLAIRLFPSTNGGAGIGYCDHFDDLL